MLRSSLEDSYNYFWPSNSFLCTPTCAKSHVSIMQNDEQKQGGYESFIGFHYVHRGRFYAFCFKNLKKRKPCFPIKKL